jgi:gliding motility-associated-like protein
MEASLNTNTLIRSINRLPLNGATQPKPNSITAAGYIKKTTLHSAATNYLLIFLFFLSVFVVGAFSSLVGQDTIFFNSTCLGKPVQFTSTVFTKTPFPSSIQWNFGDAASGAFNTANGIKQPSHIYNTKGAYTVTLDIVDPIGTYNVVGVITIVDQTAYNFGPDIGICGDTGSYTLMGPIVSGATYEWNDILKTKTPAVTVTASGTYTVKINGCAVSDTVGVYFTPIPMLDLGKDHLLCKSEVLTLTATNQNARYVWKLNGNTLPFQESQLPVTAPGGEYIVTIDVLGCGVYSDTVNIRFSDSLAPAFSLGPDTLLCPKQIYNLVASLPGAIAYNWSSMGLRFDAAVNYKIDSTNALNIDLPGRYWCFVTSKDGCEVVDTVQVKYRGDRKLDFNDTAICKGEFLILNADFGTGDYTWQSLPAQRKDQNISSQANLYVYKSGFYAVTAKVGPCVYMDSLRVQFNDSLKVKMQGDTLLCIGEPFVLHPTGNAITYTWQDSTITNYYPVSKTGTYKVVAKNGCGADTLQAVVNFTTCPCQLNLPTAFTPNGDGRNDNFRPLHACNISNFRIMIYNRYGELLYQNTDLLRGWNGVNKTGSAAPSGAYVWVVNYTNTDTKQVVQKKGSVLLIR